MGRKVQNNFYEKYKYPTTIIMEEKVQNNFRNQEETMDRAIIFLSLRFVALNYNWQSPGKFRDQIEGLYNLLLPHTSSMTFVKLLSPSLFPC